MATTRTDSPNSPAATRSSWPNRSARARWRICGELAAEQRLTLLTATKQPEISEAQVLAELIRS
jgi:hypothetical protein